MFITKTKSECKLCKKRVVNDIGLGEDSEYEGQTKTGQTVVPLVSQASEMIGKATGTGLIVGMLPGGVVKSLGVDMNPASLLLAPMTFGASLLPGVSKILGKAFNVFSGLFKKATHMGDCMKWFNNTDNIKGMSAWVQPYPIEQVFSFEEYMMKNFPQFLRQYQIMQAGGQWASVGVDSYLKSVSSGISNMSVRRQKIQDIFLRLVQENSQIKELQCAVQHSGESGYTGHTKAQVDEIWDSLREAARQEEYQTTSKLISNIPARIDALVAPFKPLPMPKAVPIVPNAIASPATSKEQAIMIAFV